MVIIILRDCAMKMLLGLDDQRRKGQRKREGEEEEE